MIKNMKVSDITISSITLDAADLLNCQSFMFDS